MEREASVYGSPKQFKTFFVTEANLARTTYKFDIDPNITVGEFREIIAKTSGIPDKAYFKLIFNGMPLANNVRLSDYNNYNTFHIIRTFYVFVVDALSRKTHTIKGLIPTDSVFTLKTKLEQATGVDLSRMKLIFAGNELINQDTLQQHKITNESTLHVLISDDMFVPFAPSGIPSRYQSSSGSSSPRGPAPPFGGLSRQPTTAAPIGGLSRPPFFSPPPPKRLPRQTTTAAPIGGLTPFGLSRQPTTAAPPSLRRSNSGGKKMRSRKNNSTNRRSKRRSNKRTHK